MSRFLIYAVVPLAVLASPAIAQSPTDRLTPTIPESQIEPAPLSSPYEFLSVATSASDFVLEASALAAAKEASAEVKAVAEKLTASHRALKTDLAAAGKADGVEVAKPAMDGEQTGLLGKLQPLDGAEFDAAYLDAQLFVHQRTIAYYRGYAEKQDGLGEAAKRLLPTVVADYVDVVTLAEKSATATPAAQ